MREQICPWCMHRGTLAITTEVCADPVAPFRSGNMNVNVVNFGAPVIKCRWCERSTVGQFSDDCKQIAFFKLGTPAPPPKGPEF